MSIKADKWIRRMAEEHGMIEPYEPGQVRSVDGHRIVSYGTSSYGYDIRCSNEFKLFTNLNSTIVDPKNFDPNSFVDMKGDFCIIPPNSFALARTVEYFRIPRNVLTICLGKCVTADTRVVDATTGALVSIAEMREGMSTIGLDGWSTRRAGVSAFVPQGKKPVFELRTRAGLRIKVTANHPFRQLHGWTALENLRPGDRIAAAREIPVFGSTPLPDWEASLLGLMISDGQCRTPGHSPTFTSSDPVLVALLERAVQAGGLGCVTKRPQLGYRIVNHAGRGGLPEKNRANLWLERHGLAVTAGDKFVPRSVFTAPKAAVRLFLQALYSGDGGVYSGDGSFFVEYYSKSRRLVEDVRHLLLRFGVFSRIRQKTTAIGTQAFTAQISDREQIRRFAREIGFCPGSVKQQRMTETTLPAIDRLTTVAKSNFDTLPREAWPSLLHCAVAAGTSLNRMSIKTNPVQSVGRALAKRVANATSAARLRELLDGPVWDTVESIEPCGVEEVFDLTVPGIENFVANDLFVHNSTYARCFSADTRVALVDGTSPTLEEMARGADSGELYWGYSIGENGRVIVSLLDTPRYIGRDAVIEIELDNGERIRATPDHEFVLRDGRMLEAAALRPGQSLMPLYRDLFRGYEMVYQPINGHLIPTHRLADEWNLRGGIYDDAPGTHRRHIDFDRRNNRPVNIERMPASEHIRLHNAESYGPEFDPIAHGEAISDALTRRASDPEWKERHGATQAQRARMFWSDPQYAAVREEVLAARRNPSDITRERHRDATHRRFLDPEERLRQGRLMAAAWARDDSAGRSLRNHKIVAIREVSGEHDVYCLTVPEAGNFALQAGVFVRNCGIIVNVTPFEPEWEGYVTLEFSNTTPLPAKIYANEGVAQVIFFESDEVCETSYKDRGGKYQGQQGVTLPKM